MAAGVTAAPTEKRRLSRLAIVLMVLSLLVGVVCTIRIGMSVMDSLTQPSFDIPGSTTVDINDAGTYAVFEQTGSQSQNGVVTVTTNGATVLRPADVTVSGPDGEPITTSLVSGSETLTRNGTIYTASIEFDADTAGEYEVAVTGGRPGGSAVIARRLTNQFAALAPWLIGAILAGFVLLGAIIGLIVSAVRRSRANRAAWRPPPPPAHAYFPPPPPRG
jgi:hypothetical protein